MCEYKTSNNLILLSIICICLYNCASAPKFGPEPTLEFVSISKATMEQGFFNNDSVTLVLNFTDGDGDIGGLDGQIEQNLFLIDNRTESIADQFVVPTIPEQGINNGIQGEIRIRLYTTCCLIPTIPACESSPDFPLDTVTYDVYLIDRAGNQSNTVTTSLITLLCN